MEGAMSAVDSHAPHAGSHAGSAGSALQVALELLDVHAVQDVQQAGPNCLLIVAQQHGMQVPGAEQQVRLLVKVQLQCNA
eukprot:CAMPEP_0202917310 /NCGR_PEP_ID=MMETSP1392-20130828/70705_1 /ASSEMBLY_ACC=CAM_ASM_000868 /TAXON_ID=225041 /ORGANISM="Chlamydomonas chlamydogama, Strain SAG 11-48b" /LENGTH=79 /DNA_ID=CAMNT_0049610027 /DNA_START=258 /DNA_END=493 /DNA_ORIENTATION=-